MKRNKCLLYVFLLSVTMALSISITANNVTFSDYFNLSSSKDKKVLSLEKTISAHDTIDLKEINMPIAGLSVDMDINAFSDDFFVRLIMEDINGNIYLVAESAPTTTLSKDISFTDYCEETRLLWNVIPKELRIHSYGATASLKRLNYVPFNEKGSQDSYMREQEKTKAEQAQEKCSIIRTHVRQQGRLWFPEVTALSQMSFSERMRILGFSEATVTDGIEYYSGGVFDFRSHSWEGELPVESDTSLTRTLCIEEFSWRDQHGKDWLTPVKDQGQSGYCSAFTAISCTEAIANLYYNQEIDMDLSEQEAAVCNGDPSPWTGMPLSSPLIYLKNHGVCEESAYPFRLCCFYWL